MQGVVALVFRCKVIGGQLSANDEAVAFKWVAEDDILQLANEAYAVRVLDALHEHSAVSIRQHDGVRIL